MGTPSQGLRPHQIFDFLAARVLGQDEALRGVAVSIYKHLYGIRGGRIFLIGGSGTGKTTLMRAIQHFFMAHPALKPFAAMCIVNARTLVDENGDVDVLRIFQHLEADARRLLGPDAEAREVAAQMERGTICLDEVDKISGKLAGKPDVVGLSLQQALLTFIEGEQVQHAVRERHGEGRHDFSLNTGRMLFVCGGAFEELYDQVYRRVENKEDERRLREVRTYDSRLGMRTDILFSLKEYMKLADLYAYGMAPQFISRFSGVTLLEDLHRGALREILLKSEESPYRISRQYFATMDIELVLTAEAVDIVVDKAYENARIGARALREVFAKVITALEFDPFGSGLLQQKGEGWRLVVKRELAQERLHSQDADPADAMAGASKDAAEALAEQVGELS
ncbi:AAA family ATPase [Megalodesulfovibrio gigas]|uniref:Putative ATPase n=1 Tax=Megalodesulfovibrio gigas (strain ATCC 19364 / DSM 1382 / NCIMB 9332 / VKM B-1759) TaxID=1121448 RepID=T2GB66_MEGG1|nr:AAA family ATPase [Megalodesulfovibrio gigas]AGW13419.1 putative ATPase [Megalodesulfovibrio gigas DSM 1382 = ATCC 19364]